MSSSRRAACSGICGGRPREHGRDDEVAFAHMVGDLELEVREAGGFGGEDVRAVVAVSWLMACCAGLPGGDRAGGEAPLPGVLAEQPGGGVQAGGRKLYRQPVRAAGVG